MRYTLWEGGHSAQDLDRGGNVARAFSSSFSWTSVDHVVEGPVAVGEPGGSHGHPGCDASRLSTNHLHQIKGEI